MIARRPLCYQAFLFGVAYTQWAWCFCNLQGANRLPVASIFTDCVHHVENSLERHPKQCAILSEPDLLRTNTPAVNYEPIPAPANEICIFVGGNYQYLHEFHREPALKSRGWVVNEMITLLFSLQKGF